MIQVRDTLLREARWRAHDPLLGICGRLDHLTAQLQATVVQNANLQAQLAEAGNQGGDDNDDGNDGNNENANDADDGGIVE